MEEDLRDSFGVSSTNASAVIQDLCLRHSHPPLHATCIVSSSAHLWYSQLKMSSGWLRLPTLVPSEDCLNRRRTEFLGRIDKRITISRSSGVQTILRQTIRSNPTLYKERVRPVERYLWSIVCTPDDRESLFSLSYAAENSVPTI